MYIVHLHQIQHLQQVQLTNNNLWILDDVHIFDLFLQFHLFVCTKKKTKKRQKKECSMNKKINIYKIDMYINILMVERAQKQQQNCKNH